MLQSVGLSAVERPLYDLQCKKQLLLPFFEWLLSPTLASSPCLFLLFSESFSKCNNPYTWIPSVSIPPYSSSIRKRRRLLVWASDSSHCEYWSCISWLLWFFCTSCTSRGSQGLWKWEISDWKIIFSLDLVVRRRRRISEEIIRAKMTSLWML